MNKSYLLLLASLIALTCSAMGCGKPSQPDAEPGKTGVETHAHAHPTEGPHHGELIELGNEEFHGELVHDEASVTIYVLDSAATRQVAIASTEVTVNGVLDGTPSQFQLAAMPDTTDAAGTSSRFSSDHPELLQMIDHSTAEMYLAVTIDGKQYRGQVKHHHGSHDHTEHGHNDHEGHQH